MKAKIVNYRNGLVLFEIPEHWKEEIDESNGGMFYEDVPDSSTLRLEVLTFQNKTGTNVSMVNDLVAKSGYELFRGNMALQRYSQRTEEAGDKITIYYWKVGSTFGKNELNIFCFSYTILTEQEIVESFKNEIYFLDQSIRSAEYAK